MAKATFLAARPVWPVGREREMNLFVGFRAVFNAPPGGRPVLRVTAASVYRAFLNGQHLGYGPARTARGWQRVDEWDLAKRLQPGRNVVAIEVAGYNVNGYYLINQPAFLQAEVACEGRTLAATGSEATPFRARVLGERLQRVRRYSFQRPFSEAYRLKPGFDAWRQAGAREIATPCAIQPRKRLLTRDVPYPDFACRAAVRHIERGGLRTGVAPEKVWSDRADRPDRRLLGYPENELETNPTRELQFVRNVRSRAADMASEDAVALRGNAYHLLDFGLLLTGFIGAEIVCRKAGRLFFTFDEILSDGDVDFKRGATANVVELALMPGKYRFESFEPYAFRYLKLLTLGGEVEVRGTYLREYANPLAVAAHFACADDRLNRIFEAGRETFRQNAVDLFTDCPGRERAGWLCDSFFTARAALALCGDVKVETAFLENYHLPRRFPHLPRGMLPMCYPADFHDGNFIPNWAMWFVLQLEEYAARGGDAALVTALRSRVTALFDYFARFLNEDGLLEKLERWVFVEWSMANKFVQDVNYPSNMLYAASLGAAGRLYGDAKLCRQANQVCKAVTEQSFDGSFFVDNAVRTDGRLQVTRNRTEVCQYFAFYFGLATPQSHPHLWKTMLRQFGPRRDVQRTFPKVHPANAFIGNMLRMELLSRYGHVAQMLEESVDYWLYMAERTGTLWEFMQAGGSVSCNHGFTSHIAHVYYRDVLGLRCVDLPGRRVTLRFQKLPLPWCRGAMPTPDGPIKLWWKREGRKLVYHLTMPAGFRVETENPDGLDLQRLD